MKKVIIALVVLAVIVLGGVYATKKYHEYRENTLDSKYKKICEDSLSEEDYLYIEGGKDLFCNFLSFDKWPQDKFFADMVDLYNSDVFLNGFRTINDNWMRFEDPEQAAEDITYADVSIIRTDDLRDLLNRCIHTGHEFYTQGADDITQIDTILYYQFQESLEILDSTLSTRFNIRNYADMTDEKYWAVVDYKNQVGDLYDELNYDELIDENRNTPESDEDIELILKKIEQENDDFNKKCAYAMAYVYYTKFWSADFEIIESLLDDGRYSNYLFFLWRMWRCDVQLSPRYGPSTWSEIPNKLYNEKRLRIAEATLSYIVDHRDDAIAINQFLVTSAISNILRRGQYPLGNESFTDLHYLGFTVTD